MVHPEYRLLGANPEMLDDRLTPIYPLTEGQTQGRVRAAVNKALARLAASPAEDLLPSSVVAHLSLCRRCARALEFMHHPPGGHFARLAGYRLNILHSAGSRSRNCWRTSSRSRR